MAERLITVVNPAGKAPTKLRVRGQGYRVEDLKKYGPALRKMHSGFDKLDRRQQALLANRKSLQEHYPDEVRYTDKAIRNQLLSYLGVASGEFDDYKAIGKDSAGREQTRKKQERKNPAGFAHGGTVHKGRKAMRGAD